MDHARLPLTLCVCACVLGAQETAVARERLLGGVSKLTATNTTVEEMRTALRLLQPVLADKTEATQRLLEQVTHEQYEAEHVRAAVAGEEADVKAQAAKLAALKVRACVGGRRGCVLCGRAPLPRALLAPLIRRWQNEPTVHALIAIIIPPQDEAQADLEEVLPALEAAERALSALNKTDIIEIKTFTKPPALVQTTMEAVCILLQVRVCGCTGVRLCGCVTYAMCMRAYSSACTCDCFYYCCRFPKRVTVLCGA